jgi:hypothetical protein
LHSEEFCRSLFSRAPLGLYLSVFSSGLQSARDAGTYIPQKIHTTTENRWAGGPAVVLYIAAAAFLIQFVTATRYGIFRDELYYIACSKHLDWGYVDQPPLIALLTWLARSIGGESLHALRFLPAVAGAIVCCRAHYLKSCPDTRRVFPQPV